MFSHNHVQQNPLRMEQLGFLEAILMQMTSRWLTTRVNQHQAEKKSWNTNGKRRAPRKKNVTNKISGKLVSQLELCMQMPVAKYNFYDPFGLQLLCEVPSNLKPHQANTSASRSGLTPHLALRRVGAISFYPTYHLDL